MNQLDPAPATKYIVQKPHPSTPPYVVQKTRVSPAPARAKSESQRPAKPEAAKRARPARNIALRRVKMAEAAPRVLPCRKPADAVNMAFLLAGNDRPMAA